MVRERERGKKDNKDQLMGKESNTQARRRSWRKKHIIQQKKTKQKKFASTIDEEK